MGPFLRSARCIPVLHNRGMTDLDKEQQESDEKTCRPLAPREDFWTRIQAKSEQTNRSKTIYKQEIEKAPCQNRPQVQSASEEDCVWWTARTW